MTKTNMFIHVPKCAGMSVTKYLKSLSGDPVLIDSINTDYYPHTNKRDFNLVKPDFTFAFIRNPFDRLVSAYKTKWVSEDYHQGGFKNFVKHYLGNQEANDNSDAGSFFRWSHVMPWTDPRMKLFDADGNKRIDYYGRFENFSDEIEEIIKKLGLSNPKKFPHENNNHRKKHYSEMYDDETYAIASKFYKTDLELSHYKFEEK